jgi:hypothetical protein
MLLFPAMAVPFGLPDRVGPLPDPFFPIRSHGSLLAARTLAAQAILIPPG